MFLMEGRMRLTGIVISVGLITVSAGAVANAAPSCALPASIPATHTQKPSTARNVATAGYLLSFSWSPEACFKSKRAPRDTAQDIEIQCGKSNHFAFVLHGLWPEGSADQQWPQYCKPVPPVSAATVRGTLCRTPSVSLIEHEWEKHGSCGWPSAEAYFAQSAKLMDRVNMPDMSGLTRGQVNASAVRAAFVASNPGLPHDAIGVAANKGGWFEEVRLCLDTAFKYRACTIYSLGSADGDRLKVARVR
jgi:ribonuclease T2